MVKIGYWIWMVFWSWSQDPVTWEIFRLLFQNTSSRNIRPSWILSIIFTGSLDTSWLFRMIFRIYRSLTSQCVSMYMSVYITNRYVQLIELILLKILIFINLLNVRHYVYRMLWTVFLSKNVCTPVHIRQTLDAILWFQSFS